MLNGIIPRTHRFHCPDEHDLAAYVDQQLIGAERERVESHLAKCDSCLRQVGFLVKQSETVAGTAPASLVHHAEHLKTFAHKGAFFGWKWLSAAAAIAMVATGVVISRNSRPNLEGHSTIVATAQHDSSPITHDTPKSSTDAAVRSVSPPASLPLVLSPQPGAIVHVSDFTIRWEAVPEAVAYEVRVVSADGDLIWHTRIQGNSVSPPKQTLRPGLKYFVWVRAWLADGKTQQSAAVGFIGG